MSLRQRCYWFFCFLSFSFMLEYSCHHPDANKTTFHHNSAVLRSSEEFTSRYKEEKLLGEGGFSKVYAGECRSTSTPVAIKHISKEDVEYVKVNCQGNVYNEILEVFLLDQAAGCLCDGSFKNPAVIGLMDVFQLETEVIIVMERLPDTVDGFDYLLEVNHIPEDKIKVIFTQIINAALLMHKNGVFHRDLKLENILVNRNKGTPEIRVIDFGCGDFVQNEPFRDFCGTLEFAPPEHIRGETYKAEATTVWQIGVMLHMTCTGVCFETSEYIKKDKEVLKNVSKECNDFLSQCLALDPNQRPTLEDLLLHPWLELTGPHEPETLKSTSWTWATIPSFPSSSTGSNPNVSSTTANDSLLEVLEYSCHHPDANKTTFHHNSAVLRSSEEFTSRYKEEKLLGEGGFSKVYAGECRSTSTPVAIKHISKEDVEYVKVNCQGNVYNEILEVFLLDQAAGCLCDGSFKNPAVIGLMDVFQLETEVIIVMERLPDTVDGFDYLLEVNHIPEDKIKVIFTQIINAALLMHKNGVFHRDLKLENILVNRNKGTPEIRVIDFGCGDFVQNEPFRDFCGTLEFAPPEHIRGETYKAEATTVWQIGVMLHMTCTGVCFETSEYIKKDKEVLKNVSKECNDFLSQCLALDPNQRPTLEDLLLHPWLELTELLLKQLNHSKEVIIMGDLNINWDVNQGRRSLKKVMDEMNMTQVVNDPTRITKSLKLT
uniref:non-specific serine/threonine protein kinase n=1 Tax=Gouania willdenowi TaxID=441366 RepID=A0A8C5GTD4_GOUWI